MASQPRVVASSVETVNPIVPILRQEVVYTLLTGIGVGLAVMAIYLLLKNYVFEAVMCREGATGQCSEASKYAMTISLIIGSIGGLIALVQARVYRPLLVVVASAVAMWNFNLLTQNTNFWVSAFVTVILFAIVYLLFVWLARLRSFPLAVIATAIVVVILRIALVA